MTNLNQIKSQKLFTLKVENIPNLRDFLLKIDNVMFRITGESWGQIKSLKITIDNLVNSECHLRP